MEPDARKEEEIDAVFESIDFTHFPDEVRILSLAEAAELQAQDTSEKIGSGFRDLDDCMDGGFREGDVNVISGIPGEGKTTLARMFTLNFAAQGIPSVWFSHEMTMRELWDSFEKMGADKSLISYVPSILESDLDTMLTHIDKAIAERGIKAVFIDTLGDVEKSREKGVIENYSTALKQICKVLRDFAVSRRIMIFEVAHCTKQTRSNSNETNNADIADSNGIAAAATNIFHVWRDNDTDNCGYVKIGKSRRDGTKKNWKFDTKLEGHRLNILHRKLDDPLEGDFRKR
jgi:replicative DNA helicase